MAGQYHRDCDAEGNAQGTNKACSRLAMSGHTDGGGVRIEHAATREKTVGLNGTAQQPQYMHCNQAGQSYRLEEGRVEGPRCRANHNPAITRQFRHTRTPSSHLDLAWSCSLLEGSAGKHICKMFAWCPTSRSYRHRHHHHRHQKRDATHTIG